SVHTPSPGGVPPLADPCPDYFILARASELPGSIRATPRVPAAPDPGPLKSTQLLPLPLFRLFDCFRRLALRLDIYFIPSQLGGQSGVLPLFADGQRQLVVRHDDCA